MERDCFKDICDAQQPSKVMGIKIKKKIGKVKSKIDNSSVVHERQQAIKKGLNLNATFLVSIH